MAVHQGAPTSTLEAAPLDGEGAHRGARSWPGITRQWPAAACCRALRRSRHGAVRPLRLPWSGPHDRHRLSGLHRADLVAGVGGACAAGRPQPLPGPRAERPVRREFRAERVHAGRRYRLCADHEVVRARGGLEHRPPSVRRRIGRFHVLRPAPVDHLVAGRLPRRTALRLLPVHDSSGQEHLSHLRATAPTDLPPAARDPGAAEVAAGPNRSSARPPVCGAVLHLVRGARGHGDHGRARDGPDPPHGSPCRRGALALCGDGRRLVRWRRGPAAALPVVVHVRRAAASQRAAGAGLVLGQVPPGGPALAARPQPVAVV